MFEDMKHYMMKVVGIEDKSFSESTDGIQVDFPKTEEQTTVLIEEPLKPLYKLDKLKRLIRNGIFECYPHTRNLIVDVLPSKSYIGNGKYLDKYCLTVSWENGASECLVSPIVDCALCDYFDDIDNSIPRKMIQVQARRIFTEDIILKVSRTYANCIAPNLPLNMHNIKCFKIGGVPIYELAIGELRLMDEVR